MKRLLLLALLLIINSSSSNTQEIERKYFPVTIAKLASGTNGRTHVEVTGKIGYKKRQGDQDWHLRLDDGIGYVKGHWIVAECIPELTEIYARCTSLKVGDLITVRGISRQDPEHKWYEVHPVEKIF